MVRKHKPNGPRPLKLRPEPSPRAIRRETETQRAEYQPRRKGAHR